ncbi:dTDP-4-dehydrorhamnose reductase [uncultured Bilophila sp.]|uniref:dTDP-4-dehydrorhamnose reductase n=1 Tax=uncultured Bilophila sp. TaxID=529385 RepID=UPI00280A7E0B|nr:dTDP-4-dehydrorhamnose reductase [uncultured Bilophila sp.]
MKILLTGGKGMLGRTLCTQWQDWEVIPSGSFNADITDAEGFDTFLRKVRPEVLIHCAAITTVDKCESIPDVAYRVNALGTANVAAACHRNGVRLIAISTDYVFDGYKDRPYHEFDTPTGGVNIYGQSKYAGEQAVRAHCPNHIIVRTSWLYGTGGPSFVHTMLRLADDTRPPFKVVNDQHGNPTSTLAVARALREIVIRPLLVGTFHLTCEGEATWFEFAREIFRLAGKTQPIIPCVTSEYPTPALRPANSRLEKRMLRLCGLPPMPDWHESLVEFMKIEQG